ncbi:MAG: polysaccharide deacetylase family protein [Candidatus Krumholzibacteriia bacterium]
MKYGPRKNRKDLRNATYSALVTSMLLLVLLVLMAGYESPNVDESSITPIQAHRGDETSLPYDIERDGIPVLCHHFLREKSSPFQVVKILGALFLNLPLLDDMDVWTQTIGSFEQQMRYLHEEGYRSVGLDDLIEWQEGRLKLPPKSVVITFDDGDRSVLLAEPVLERYGFTATLFIITGRVGVEWEGLETLGWDEIRELQARGRFSIQSHSHDLHYSVKTREGRMPVLAAASGGLYAIPGAGSWRDIVFDDLRESRRVIAERLGTIPRFLAWPYGSTNSELDSIAVAAGFAGACTLVRGSNKAGDRFTAAPRERRTPDADPRFPATIPFYRLTGAQASPHGAWERYEVNRLTITARTSLRTFRQMLTPGGRR